MILPYIILAILSMACFAIITAALKLSQTVWKYCPWCKQFGSDLGETDRPPRFGRVSDSHGICDSCAVEQTKLLRLEFDRRSQTNRKLN